jgi:membrane peptidoglycan carboxypeptidase
LLALVLEADQSVRNAGTGYQRRVRRLGTNLANTLVLVICGVIAGVVLAAAALPGVAGAGLGAKTAVDSFDGLPSELKTPPLPTNTNVLTADGQYVTSFFDENRVPVTLSQVPVVMRHAMIAAEDARFYLHRGVDLRGVIRALVANHEAGHVTQGASTLTQQYVKRVLLQQATTPQEIQDAQGTTPGRKLREMRYAIALEQHLSKDQILERYLNIAYFGHQAYGIGAAAQVYFSEPVSKLTLAQSALLAGLVQSPTYYDPIAGHKNAARDRRDYVLDRMQELGYITAAQNRATRRMTGLGLHPKTVASSCETPSVRIHNWGFFCSWLTIWWQQQKAFGSTPQERLEVLKHGGFTIKLSLDPKVQDVAQHASDADYLRNDPRAKGIVLLDPHTGRVKAMAINRTFSSAPNPGGKRYPNTVFPLLTGNPANPTSVGYQSGSTFKIFAIVAALQAGLPLSHKIKARSTYVTDYPDHTPGNCGGFYCPKNYEGAQPGTYDMRTGLRASINTFFVPLELDPRVGVTRVVDAATAMGIRLYPGPRRPGVPTGVNSADAIRADHRPTFTLGEGSNVYPLFVASAYGTLATRGIYCEPTPVLEIRDSHGNLVKTASTPRCRRVLPASVADAATDAARCPVGDQSLTGTCHGLGGATAASVGRALNRPVAGKTGSTPSDKAVWFAGFIPQLAAASFGANPDAPNTPHSGNAIAVDRVFSRTMEYAAESLPVENFVAPPPELS